MISSCSLKFFSLHFPRIIVLAGAVFFLISCGRADMVDSEGRGIRLANYKNKWVLVNYWASWCVPCLRELPELNQFYKSHENAVLVLGVNFDHWPDERLNAFKKQYHLAFPLLNHFPTEKYGIKQIPTVPVTLLIGKKGELMTILMGPQNKERLERLLR